MKNRTGTLVICLFLFLLSFSLAANQNAATPKGSEFKFTNLEQQTKEFIGYNTSIQLTLEQEKIKTEALNAIAAPCCKEFTIATCCCPCNLAKSVWGLSNYLIAKENYSAAKVKETVNAWIQYTHPNGFQGDACFQGRCDSSFHQDGCAGMNDKNIVY